MAKVTFNSKSTVLAIGDMHAPFQHVDTLDFLKAVEKKYQPNDYVCLGDEMDAHAISDYDADPDGLSPGDELKAAIKALRPIYRAFPNMKVCTSNHTARPFKKAYKSGISRRYLKDYREFLDAPAGWSWSDSWEIDEVVYEHGEPYAGKDAALKCALGNFKSTVIGHIHAFAGIQWVANKERLLFGFNVGCLINTKAYAFDYGAAIKNKPIIGVGVVRKGIPIYEPMLLNRAGRWTGKL